MLLSLTFALLFRASESSVAMFTFHLASCIIYVVPKPTLGANLAVSLCNFTSKRTEFDIMSYLLGSQYSSVWKEQCT